MHQINLSAKSNEGLKNRLEKAGISPEQFNKDAENLSSKKKGTKKNKVIKAKNKRVSLNIHLRLYQVRDWNKLTQVQFAEGLGKSTPAFFCDDNVICRVEKGIRDVEPEFLAAVSARFGVSLHWLITGTGAVTAEPDAFKDRTIIEKWSDFRLDLNSEKFDYDTPEDFPAVDASTFNDPESFTTLLKYMIHDVDIRERMFKQFFMIDKPSADRKHKG